MAPRNPVGSAHRAAGWGAVLLAAIVACLAALALPRTTRADQPGQGTEEYCLSCHGDPDLSLTLSGGETLSLFISRETLDQSIHSPLGIECEACHTNITTYPHPPAEYATRRELVRDYYLSCRKCHGDQYEKTLDSMHAQAAAAGNLDAPVCTDCHGAHDVHPPDQPRAHLSEICGQCHPAVFEQYRDSVHGAALIQQGVSDVPVCTDCHGVHNIQDARLAQFRIASPELCAGCHADAELMSKYGLSADVYNLYTLSWHGVDVSVYKASWPSIWHDSAVCTDCHGVHDILPAGDPDSTVNPAHLLATCQKCHPAAGPNWTGAWTGHNQISRERTSFLFYTQAFYNSFTPSVLWLSGLYVVLQAIRAFVARVRRSL